MKLADKHRKQSMIMVAVLNNLPEIIMGAVYTGVVFWGGRRFERRFGSKVRA